jgi:hypothetical protein
MLSASLAGIRLRMLTILGIVTAMALVGLSDNTHVYADEDVPTNAVVSGAGTAPTFECKWELPDVDDNAANGIQYGDDDDPLTEPGFPCDLPAGGGPPIMADGVQHMIQVLPNAEDLPTEKAVQLWAAVDHINGVGAISDVYWKVFHPDGTFKVQVHGTSQNCNLNTNMKNAAIATGQVTQQAFDDPNNGMVARCLQGGKAFYRAQFEISKHQPCGPYRIEAHAVSNGLESVLTNYIDVICFYSLEIDFDSVDWGPIAPGIDKYVLGDLVFLPPSDVRPTVKNTGNSGMGLGLLFDQMIQSTCDANGCTPVAGGKIINLFDAKFGKSPGTLQTIDPIPAGVQANFDDNIERVLCSNEIGKLDLSIHPPSTLPAGTYVGMVHVLARSVAICPTDQAVAVP